MFRKEWQPLQALLNAHARQNAEHDGMGEPRRHREHQGHLVFVCLVSWWFIHVRGR